MSEEQEPLTTEEQEPSSPEVIPEPSPSPLTLEIGCGDIPSEEYTIHLDARALPGVEVVAKWQDATFAESMFDRVFSSQTFEHLYHAEQREALRRTLTWLKPGAILEIWTPCLNALAARAVSGEITWEWFQEVTYGSQDYPENCHRWCHTLDTLRAMAELCGFEVIECAEYAGSIKLIARKPKST